MCVCVCVCVCVSEFVGVYTHTQTVHKCYANIIQYVSTTCSCVWILAGAYPTWHVPTAASVSHSHFELPFHQLQTVGHDCTMRVEQKSKHEREDHELVHTYMHVLYN